ncbi:secondary thiamine-phosphate synthase enzyme YjbQ [Vallitalea guaymasensis]|uniref:secondary thiamine-phosphate synthase enzyme YjbQ n=1 Tax=Vallitalea guaymasensis TaxID=1185412 RepID=UPI002355E2DF|nr:secondary thiamine-phosphate synthase enzyme YjbQ [Vallitalea guaymasensis]
MITKMIQVKTNKHTEMIDITSKVQNIIESEGVEDGICTVFIPHTTAGVTINENADPDVTRDMLMEMNKIVPLEDGYRHMEGNSAAHIKSSMMGFSETIIIKEGRLLLGTWQGIYFCEFDGPRNRKSMINIIIEK